MSATTLTYGKPIGIARPVLRAAAPTAPARPIVTRAETAECTCPDACERDHELD